MEEIVDDGQHQIGEHGRADIRYGHKRHSRYAIVLDVFGIIQP